MEDKPLPAPRVIIVGGSQPGGWARYSQQPGASHQVIEQEDVREDARKENEDVDDDSADSDDDASSASEDQDAAPSNNENDEAPPAAMLSRRRFSLPKIPLPPLEKQSSLKEAESLPTEATATELRRPSGAMDIYKNFREVNERKLSQSKDQLVHVESKGKFRTMKKGVFQIERILERERQEELEKRQAFIVPSRLHDIGGAYHMQRSFNKFSSIVQGFLAGLTLGLPLFTFNFATEELLEKGYRWISMPIHAVFAFAFTFGLISAVDRIGVYKSQHFSSYLHFREAIANNSFLGIVLWSVGLCATLLCIRFDESLSLVKKEIELSPNLIVLWRTCSVIRAVCAGLGWMLQYFQRDSDIVSTQLKAAVIDDIKHTPGVTSENIAERKDLTLQALSMD